MTKEQSEKLSKFMYYMGVFDIILAIPCLLSDKNDDAMIFLFLAALNILGSMITPKIGTKK